MTPTQTPLLLACSLTDTAEHVMQYWHTDAAVCREGKDAGFKHLLRGSSRLF